MTVADSLSRWMTWRDIHVQPSVWKDWGRELDVRGLRRWITSMAPTEVWFCGAGTNACVGDIFVGGVEGRGGPWFRSIPSSELVTRPHKYLTGRTPLVVNYGRSGDSAENIGTLDALDALCPRAPWLNITCNPHGALARVRTGPGQRVIVLPKDSNDKGFVMTCSFSTMLLTTLALFDPPCNVSDRMSVLAETLCDLLPRFVRLAGPPPERAVFIGTGPMAQAAKEAALKVLKLSGGRIPTMSDSILGLRYGAQALVSGDTVITMFTSVDKHAARYEADILTELKATYPGARIRTIGPQGDIDLPMPFGEAWAAPIAVASAQVAGVVWADALGVNVDNPFGGQGGPENPVSTFPLYPVKS